MGGEDKEKQVTKPSQREEKSHDVFDVAISELLQDFTSAELFPQSTDGVPQGASSCPDSNWDGVVVSMKDLHLHRPCFARQRRHRKCVHRKRQSSNYLNLAVAASSYQRPIVWPARLSNQNKKTNSLVLYPSRLCVNGNHDKEFCTNNMPTTKLKTTLKSCSEEEKSRIETVLQGQEFVPFGSSSTDCSSLSFSGLCEQAKNSNEKIGQEPESSQAVPCSPATFSKRHSTGCVPPAKFARTVAEDDETVSHRTVFCDYRSPSSTHSELDSENDFIHYALCVGAEKSGNGSQGACSEVPSASAATSSPSGLETPCSLETLATLRSALVSSAQSPSQTTSDSSGLSLSCSQEMRMEETNVNELASYFDDMLHIPRKMSTMAEMMYA